METELGLEQVFWMAEELEEDLFCLMTMLRCCRVSIAARPDRLKEGVAVAEELDHG